MFEFPVKDFVLEFVRTSLSEKDRFSYLNFPRFHIKTIN